MVKGVLPYRECIYIRFTNIKFYLCFHIFNCCHSDGHSLSSSRNDNRKAYRTASFNPQKGEPYECGIPTRGQSWVQFKVGYYLFAILFLMFDIETVFLFPWAVVVNEVGTYALVCVAFFLLVLILGLAYAWRKGALEWK